MLNGQKVAVEQAKRKNHGRSITCRERRKRASMAERYVWTPDDPGGVVVFYAPPQEQEGHDNTSTTIAGGR